MGIFPRWSIRIFASALSTQMTSLPLSAKQAPATSPTYPVPTTAIFNPTPAAGDGTGSHVTGHAGGGSDAGVPLKMTPDLISANCRGYHLMERPTKCEPFGGDSRRLPPRPAPAHWGRRVHASAR